MTRNIEDILEGCRMGDKKCSEELLKEIKPMILKTVRGYFLQDHIREDLIQEGYVIALETAVKYDPSSEGSYYGYLKRALYYGLYNHIDKNDVLYYEEEYDGLRLIECLADMSMQPDEIAADKEEYRVLHRALKSLEGRERDVIMDRFFKAMTMRAIAKRYDVCYMTVLRIQKKALKKLRRKMEGNH